MRLYGADPLPDERVALAREKPPCFRRLRFSGWPPRRRCAGKRRTLANREKGSAAARIHALRMWRETSANESKVPIRT